MRYSVLMNKVFSYLRTRYIVPVTGLNSPGKRVITSMTPAGSSYSTYRSGTYYINLDSLFLFNNIKEEREEVLKKESKEITSNTIMYLMGLFYHEYGHVLFTSFDNEGAFSSLSYSERASAQYLFNVLEDPFIEIQIKCKIRKSRKFLNFLVEHIFRDHVSEYKDDGKFKSFAYYLLLGMRLGIDNIPERNQFYDDHKADVIKYVSKFYNETDGSKRAYIAVELYKYLVDQGMDMSEDISDDEARMPSSQRGGAPAPNQARGAGGVASNQLGGDPDGKNSSSEGASSSSAGGTNDAEGDNSSQHTAGGEISQAEADGNAVTNTSAEDYEAPTAEEFQSYDEMSSDMCGHEFTKVKDIAEISDGNLDASLEYYENNILKFQNVISGCVDTIDNFNTEHEIKMIPGYNSGVFDLDSYINQAPLDKVYARPDGIDNVPDLAFYILIDGSGSMEGSKSKLCTQAMLILHECLTQLDIPFEVSTFVEFSDGYSNKAITYIMKDFDDDPNQSRGYLTFADDDFNSAFRLPSGYGMFCCNIDEVNVAYCGKKLLDRSNTDKVMIVISDGCTCGSTDKLRARVRELEDEGVLVLGIGICDNSVEYIYDKSVVFSSTAELEEFPEFLSKFLVGLYTEE